MSKSPSLRRIQADVRELAHDPSDRYHAAPLENDMFEWHFTIRGADETDFAGGIYHGRILLPPDYPFKPPHIVFVTPSGRFETNTKICLSFSAYHPELWQPAWGIRLILEALISFLPTPADGAVGAIDWSPAERQKLARASQSYCCPKCGKVADLLPELKAKTDGDKKSSSRFQKEIQALQLLQMEAHKKQEDGDDDRSAPSAYGGNDPANPTSVASSSNLIKANETVRENAIAPYPTGSDATRPTTNRSEATTPSLVVDDNDDSSPLRENAMLEPLLGGEATKHAGTMNSATDPLANAAPVEPAATTILETAPTTEVARTNNAPASGASNVNIQQGSSSSSSIWLDPLLHSIIVLLSILCVVLARKVVRLLGDLDELEAAMAE